MMIKGRNKKTVEKEGYYRPSVYYYP